jgi:hypothetical protein
VLYLPVFQTMKLSQNKTSFCSFLLLFFFFFFLVVFNEGFWSVNTSLCLVNISLFYVQNKLFQWNKHLLLCMYVWSRGELGLPIIHCPSYVCFNDGQWGHWGELGLPLKYKKQFLWDFYVLLLEKNSKVSYQQIRIYTKKLDNWPKI